MKIFLSILLGVILAVVGMFGFKCFVGVATDHAKIVIIDETQDAMIDKINEVIDNQDALRAMIMQNNSSIQYLIEELPDEEGI